MLPDWKFFLKSSKNRSFLGLFLTCCLRFDFLSAWGLARDLRLPSIILGSCSVSAFFMGGTFVLCPCLEIAAANAEMISFFVSDDDRNWKLTLPDAAALLKSAVHALERRMGD